MAQVIVPRAVDRSKYKGKLVFIDKAGNIAVADRPKGLSVEEKAERKAKRQAEHGKVVAKRAVLRNAMSEARKNAKKNPSVATAQAYEDAKSAYEEGKD